MEDIELSRATLDDIVFENRNKSYGAFFLRKLYDKNVLTGLCLAVAIFSLALAAPVIIKLLSPAEEIVLLDDKPKDIIIIDVPIDPKIKPLPIIKIDPPQIKTMKFIPPEPAPDKEVTEPPPPPQVKLDSTKVSDQDRDGDDSDLDIPDVPVGDPNGLVDNGDELYSGSIDKEPEFPGGKDKWKKYIQGNMSPKVTFYVSQKDVKGMVVVSFVIAKDGSVSDVKILRGIANCSQCNDEAKRLIENSPKWIPAEANGHAVKIYYSQGITFKSTE